MEIRPESLPNRHDVGENLHRVVHVILQVEDRDPRPGSGPAQVLVPLPVLAGADRDRVPETRQDLRRVLRGLAMGELELVWGEKMRMSAELGDPGLDRIPRPGGAVVEDHEHRLVEEPWGWLIVSELQFQLPRHVQKDVDLVAGVVLARDEVPPSEETGHTVTLLLFAKLGPAR